MAKTIIKILRNGMIYGIVFFALSCLIGYYAFNIPLKSTLIVATPIAVSALIINGFVYSRITKPAKVLEELAFTPTNAESIKLQNPANHYINDHLISGKLFLTDTYLVFKIYQKDKGKQKEYLFPLSDVQAFKFFPSLFNAGGAFMAKDNDGRTYVFEVDEIKLWKKALT